MENMKKALNAGLVIVAMPAVGKSTLTRILTEEGWVVADSDSSKFNFKMSADGSQYVDEDGEPVTDSKLRVKNPNFLVDYEADIRRKMTESSLVFVSAHSEVREMLQSVDIPFVYFTYKEDMKAEVINRILTRNTPQPNAIIAKVTDTSWDLWMTQKEIGEPMAVVELGTGNYLAQYVKEVEYEGEHHLHIYTDPVV